MWLVAEPAVPAVQVLRVVRVVPLVYVVAFSGSGPAVSVAPPRGVVEGEIRRAGTEPTSWFAIHENVVISGHNDTAEIHSEQSRKA